MQGLSGIQLIYYGIKGETPSFSDGEGERCNMCGGRITAAGSFLIPKSDTWTDEARMEAKDSKHICEACQHMRSGSNRQNYMGKKRAAIYTPHGADFLYTDEFFERLKEDFDEPRLYVLKPPTKEAMQKHTEITANRIISYSPSNLRIGMYGVMFPGGLTLEGVAEVDAKSFVRIVEDLKNMAQKYIVPIIDAGKKKYTTPGKQFFVMGRLKDACESRTIGKGNAMLLAMYLAARLVYPDERKE